jgi:hypothetical protein
MVHLGDEPRAISRIFLRIYVGLKTNSGSPSDLRKWSIADVTGARIVRLPHLPRPSCTSGNAVFFMTGAFPSRK